MKMEENELERLELIKGYLSYEVITEWIKRTGSDPDDMVSWDIEDWINNFNEAVLMLNDEMDEVEKLRISLREEIMKLERKAMDDRQTYKCPDCNHDLSAHDAYQGTCDNCENKK